VAFKIVKRNILKLKFEMPIYLIDYGRLGKTRKDVPEEVILI